jgi:hypothetical protein
MLDRSMSCAVTSSDSASSAIRMRADQTWRVGVVIAEDAKVSDAGRHAVWDEVDLDHFSAMAILSRRCGGLSVGMLRRRQPPRTIGAPAHST